MKYLNKEKPKLLLHICCAGCGAYVSSELKNDYNVTLYYFNPNIFPEDEYSLRLREVKMIGKKFDLPVVIDDYDHKKWLIAIRGHEQDPERGERCHICYYYRLKQSAIYASEHNYDYFTTTLTVSPHKLANVILAAGKELANEYKINFLARDFKKQDGAKKATILSRKLNLYRQNYCGCEFSRRKN